MAARGPEVPQRDTKSRSLEPLLLASSRLKGPGQWGPPSLLAMRLRRSGLRQTWNMGRGEGR